MEAYTMLGEYDRAILDLKTYTLSKLGYEPAVPNDSYTQGSTSDYALYAPFYGLTVRQLPMIRTICIYVRWNSSRRDYVGLT